MRKKVICFDVDGTLVEEKASWLTLAAGLGCDTEEIIEINNRLQAGEITIPQGEKMVEELFLASGNASKDFIYKIFDNILIKDEVKPLMNYIKEYGYAIYLVSGGVDAYVDMIASKAGADGFYASASMEFDGMGELLKINYGGWQGPWKARVVEELAGKYKIMPEEILFVGDSANDIEAFKMTGKGIAVYPYDEKLGEVAWKKIKQLDEIKSLVA